MKVLCCGSRGWYNRPAVEMTLFELAPDVVIHGDAKGADRMAAQVAEGLGCEVQAFPADWKRLGQRAGFVRNLEMLDEKPDLVVAFWDGTSKGTQHTIVEALKRGITVWRVADENVRIVEVPDTLSTG